MTDVTDDIGVLLDYLSARLDEEERGALGVATLIDEVERRRPGWRPTGVPDLPFLAGFVTGHALRAVKATRLLLADLEAEQHRGNDGDWYGCQAVSHDSFLLVPGRECTCGRDDDVLRRLQILASVYDGRTDFPASLEGGR